MGIIYCATNLKNGKLYIGRTTGSLAKRRTLHIGNVKRGSVLYFHRAIRKYGEENFSWRIIDRSDWGLRELETYYIDFFGTYFPDIGYNATLDTEDCSFWSGKPRSQETRQKISNSLKGKPLTEETKKKISNSLKGERNFNFGKVRSEEFKQHLSDLNKGKKLSKETKQKMSASRQGEDHPMFGKHHSEEALQKIREARARQIITDEHRRKISEAGKKRWAAIRATPSSSPD